MPFPASKAIRQVRQIVVAEDYLRFGVLIGFMLVAAVLQVIGVASIFPFMQLVAQPGITESNAFLQNVYTLIGFDSEREMLLWLGVAVFVLFTASVGVTAFTSWLVQRTTWSAAHRLSVRQLRLYMQLPYEFFLVQSSVELLRRTVADINRLLSDVLLAGSNLVAQTILILGLFALLLLVNPLLSVLAFLGFGSVYLVLHLLRHKFLVRLGKERIDTDNRRYNAFIDAITGMKSIRAGNASRFFVDRFDRASDAYTHIYPRLELATNGPRYIMEVMAFGGILVALLLYVAIQDDFAGAIPTLSVFALATYRLMPALHSMFESAARLSNSAAIIESIAEGLRIDRLLEPELGETTEPIRFEKSIRMQQVAYQYETAREASLHDVSLTIDKGQSIALVGATGSGKTTIVDILVGLLYPDDGALIVDSTDIGPETVAGWRQILAYVPQDVFLFDATIAKNIAFGSRGAHIDEVRMRRAARAAQLDAFITGELADGYDTWVGERGVRLSGGQRQRLGIARAIYRQPQVLILDEATSALDTVTEDGVISALGNELPDVTIIMVAHRLSTVRNCDRIFLVESGQVVAVGDYDSLYDSSLQFKRMVDATRSG
ncbi:MAG: ABC transporter ATP-binding protein/permease [Gammaproteobacteria bacterium]|nr:ABC transporter ATP-binding protein/permease [Gammaproteobacteria bacterium]